MVLQSMVGSFECIVDRFDLMYGGILMGGRRAIVVIVKYSRYV